MKSEKEISLPSKLSSGQEERRRLVAVALGEEPNVGVSLLQKARACLRLDLPPRKPRFLSFGTRALMSAAFPGKRAAASEAGHLEEAPGLLRVCPECSRSVALPFSESGA